MNLRQIYYALPPRMRLMARRAYYLPMDTWEAFTGARHELQPPRGMIFTGGGDFINEGKAFLKHFVDLGDLKPQHTVLDIGSGLGRMAIPLTEYLSEEGIYHGFDIMQEGVEWCQKKISSKFPNFHFKHVALKNDLYTNQGSAAKDFVFPYANAQFDFSFLTSVFTHMVDDQVANYLKEIARVTKSGGRCLATFFLLNDEVKQRIDGSDSFAFPFDYGHYRLMDKQVQSANVAFEISWLESVCAANGLQIQRIHHGYWSGLEKSDCLNFQDIVILKKLV